MNKSDLQKATNIIIETDDPRINFTFMKKENIIDFQKNPDIFYTDRIDYQVKVGEAGETSLLEKTVPISFFDVKSLEDGIAWFKDKYPNLPKEYHEIMAKYQFEAPYNKKQLKNAMKKLNKKGHSKEIDGLQIIRNKILVHFD